MVLADEFQFNESVINEIRSLMKEWNQLDTIYCMESTDQRKEGIITKLVNLIKKIINEVKTQVKKFTTTVSNHVRYGMLSQKKKEEFDRFEEWLKNNPNAKSKTVTVKDWQKIMKEYDKVEKNIVSMMNDKTVDSRGLNKRGNDMLNSLAALSNSASAALTVDMCMVFARKSPEMARVVQTAMAQSSGAIDNIEEQLGKKEVVKLQKNLEKLSKESLGHKILATLFRQKEKTIAECVSEVSSVFTKLQSGSKLDKVKAAVEHRDLIRTAGKSYIKDKDTRKGVKHAINGAKSVTGSALGKVIGEFINPSV